MVQCPDYRERLAHHAGTAVAWHLVHGDTRPADTGQPPAPAAPARLLLASTGEGIFGIDLDGHCMFIHRAGAQMLGHEQAALPGSNVHALTHHSRPDGAHCADTDCPIFNACRRGLPCRIDTEAFWRRDGSAFAVESSSHPIMDGAQVRGAVITFVDITERGRAADALQQAKDELGLRVEERHARTDRHVAAAAERLRPLHPGAEADLAAGVHAACARHHQGLVGERHLRDLHLLEGLSKSFAPGKAVFASVSFTGGCCAGNIAEIVVNALPRERTRAGLHHLDGRDALRNPIVDFLATRAKAT
jgi:PAS domain S-box-containing protein